MKPCWPFPTAQKLKPLLLILFATLHCKSHQVSISQPTITLPLEQPTCQILISFPKIHRSLTKNLKDLEDMKINVPGSLSIRAKDMPEPILDCEKYEYQCFVDTALNMTKSSGIIVNSFELLEERAFRALENGECAPGDSMPPVYFIGPVVSEKEEDSKESRERLSWLDSQPSQSVLFLCFGSMGVFYTKQLKEIANGLQRSGVRFLWVVRTPPPNDETVWKLAETDPSIQSFLPEGFPERTKDRGYLVKSWAPQRVILSHDSVGGFVTHCGLNSILEAVCAGMPLLAWPEYAEQKMNKAFLVEEMKIALPVNASEEGLVSAYELKKRVSELMVSDKGKTVRKRVQAMKYGLSQVGGVTWWCTRLNEFHFMAENTIDIDGKKLNRGIL